VRLRPGGAVLISLLALSTLAAGCNVSLHAARVTLDLTAGGLVLENDAAARVPTGETVLSVRNNSDATVRVLLLKDAPPLDRLPASVTQAVDSLDSAMVVAVAPHLQKRKNELATGGIGYEIHATSFHVYFRPGTAYTVAVVDPSGHVTGRVLVAGGTP
jgi:hypothetical protein